MDQDLVITQLAGSLIGAAVGEAALDELRSELAWLTLPGGRALFREGESGDELYILIAGALAVSVRGADGGESIVAQIRPGETIGEMALFSGEVRSATVTAMRDSELLRLDKPSFERLVERAPRVMMPLIGQLIDRLRRATHHEGPMAMPRTIAVLPMSRLVQGAAFARRLATALAEQGGRVEFVDAGAEAQTTEWFMALEAGRDLVVYLADPEPSPWSRLCLRQADRVLLVAEAEAPVQAALPEALTSSLGTLRRPVDLILLHEGAGRVVTGLPSWTRSAPIELTCRLRSGHHGDLARLARLLTGRAIGLVLSGGGARGFAHIGVIRALRQMRVPLDLLGGCSMGAIISAGVAAEWDDRELEANMRKAFVTTSPVNDYALPLLALVRGTKVTNRLIEHFGEVAIEDLWRPFFCVSSNLTSGTLVVHRSGKLWWALRASVAIPGLLPPVMDGDAVLADGGVINNLPVDVMRGLKRGPVLGVDVASDRALASFAGRGRTSLWSLFRSGRRVPPIVDILVRAGTVSSDAQSRVLRERVDLLFDPPLEKIDILDWRAFDRVIEIGYRHAMTKLETAGDRILKAR